MAGYTDGFSSTNGDLINAILFENEYAALEVAFDAVTGHVHDGSANNGAYIPLITGPGNLTEVKVDIINDKIIFSTNVGAVKTAQLEIIDGALVPDVTNDFDLGSVGKRIKDTYTTGLSLGAGVAVSSILDQDTLSGDDATALATQQSIKAYVDGAVHTLIASPDGYNVIEVDDASDSIIISTDVASVKTNKVKVNGAAIYPAVNLDIDLGVTGTNEFNNLFAATVDISTLTVSGNSITSIIDDDTMVSDSNTALATQQSIKAYVDNNLSTVNGNIANINLGNGTVVSTSVPINAKGVNGHNAGMIAADAGFAYFCHTTWVDGVADIWSRVAIAGGF